MLRSLIVLTIMLVTPQADAQLFRRRPMKRVVVKQQVVVVPQVQTLFLVAPPSFYGTPSYTPPQIGRRRDHSHAELVAAVDTLSLVVDKLVALTARVRALESDQDPVEPPVVIPPPPPVRLPLIVQETCSKCHGGDQHKGDFSLSELGNPNRLLMSQAMVANNKMPLDADGNVVDLAPHVRAELFQALKKMETQQ